MKSCVAEQSIYDLSKIIECYEYHKKDHVLFDPIVQFSSFIFIMKIRKILSYLGHHSIMYNLGSIAIKRFKHQIRSMIGFIGSFMLIELKWRVAVDRVGRSM